MKISKDSVLFERDEKIPTICPFCGQFKEEVKLGIFGMRGWSCTSTECENIFNKIRK